MNSLFIDMTRIFSDIIFMTYAISDIHGCLKAYLDLLEEIRFDDADFLYVLGDATDRGPDSLEVLLDVLSRNNALYIPGNHDYFLLHVCPAYGFTREEDPCASPTLMTRALRAAWMTRGGRATLDQFRSQSLENRMKILNYLRTAPSWTATQAAGRSFILTHKIFPGFLDKKNFADITLWDYVKPGNNYDFNPAPGSLVISGHRCVMELRKDHKPLVFESGPHVVIDCGACQGGALAAYCLETGRAFYSR